MKIKILGTICLAFILNGCIPFTKESKEYKTFESFAADLNKYALNKYKEAKAECKDYSIRKAPLLTDSLLSDHLSIEINENKPLIETHYTFLDKTIHKNTVINYLEHEKKIKENIVSYINQCNIDSKFEKYKATGFKEIKLTPMFDFKKKIDCTKYADAEYKKLINYNSMKDVKNMEDYKKKFDAINKFNKEASIHNEKINQCWIESYLNHAVEVSVIIEDLK